MRFAWTSKGLIVKISRGNKNKGTGSVAQYFFEPGRTRNRLSVLHHAFNMKDEGFLGHRARIIQRRACGDQAREVRKGDAEVAVGVFVDESDIAGHVTRPFLVGCLNCMWLPRFRDATRLALTPERFTAIYRA